MGCVQAEGLGEAEQSRGITEGGSATVESGRVACLAAGVDECAQDLHCCGVDTAYLAGIQRQVAGLVHQRGQAVFSSVLVSIPRSPPRATVLMFAPDKRFRER